MVNEPDGLKLKRFWRAALAGSMVIEMYKSSSNLMIRWHR
jgi:hypothetical protein